MKLKDICSVFIDGDWIETKDQSDYGIRLIQTGNIGEGIFLEKQGKEKYISTETFKDLKCTEVFAGDLLISRLPEPIGRACIIPLKDDRMITAVDCTICRFDNSKVIAKYVCYFMQSKFYYNQLKKYTLGTTRKRISRKNLGTININVPNLSLQQKIVDVLDKVENLIDNRQQQLNLLDELIKSRFIEMFGDPVTNPMGWDKFKLLDKCDIVTGNTPSRNIPEYYGDTIEWIKSDNITNEIILTKAVEYLSNEGEKVGRIVEAGNILMTCIAGSIKSIGNVAITDRKVSFNQQINAIIPRQQNVFFMYEQFKLSKNYICNGVNMSLKGILSKSQLSELKFIFPPIELQNKFAVFVEQVEKSKETIKKSLDELNLLKDSLMQKYFG